METKIEQYQQTVCKALQRVQKDKSAPLSSLHLVSLLAAERLLLFLNQCLLQQGTAKDQYFLSPFSKDLSLRLFVQIFHLDNPEHFEDFVLRQLLVLAPEHLTPLPIENRNELLSYWADRIESAEQAIEIELTGIGVFRGLSHEEQQHYFQALNDGDIQKLVFPEEPQLMEKSDLDKKLESFQALLSDYKAWEKLRTPSPLFSVSREQQRFEKISAIYESPNFLAYQYYRCLLDHIGQLKKNKPINMLTHSRSDAGEQTVEKTGDRDLDQWMNGSEHQFMPWPTGEDPVFGQEQYLNHFVTEAALSQMQNLESLEHETPLVVLLFDVSGSMLAHDVEPSRFEYALDLQEGLVSQLNPSFALAQIVFSSMGVVSHMFEQNRAAFLDLLIDSRVWFHRARNVLIQDLFGFTSLGAGLLSAASLIAQARQTIAPWRTASQAEILLFTDGDHNCPPNYYQAAKYCQEQNIAVHPICCAREICVEVEMDGESVVETLNSLVSKEARERANKWKSWYQDTPFHQVLKKQQRIVLNHYRHRLQQNLQRSTGANVEALETIADLTGGHFFSGAMADRGPTSLESILEVMDMRLELREQLRAKKKDAISRKNE